MLWQNWNEFWVNGSYPVPIQLFNRFVKYAQEYLAVMASQSKVKTGLGLGAWSNFLFLFYFYNLTWHPCLHFVIILIVPLATLAFSSHHITAKTKMSL